LLNPQLLIYAAEFFYLYSPDREYLYSPDRETRSQSGIDGMCLQG